MNNKKNSRKQIKNKLLKVDSLTAYFRKKIKEVFGDTKNIEVERCHNNVYVEPYGELPAYIIYAPDEEDHINTFKIVAQRYEKGNKSRMKVIKILDIE
jgi:hypothetical protein